jgi:hypothetical protein
MYSVCLSAKAVLAGTGAGANARILPQRWDSG